MDLRDTGITWKKKETWKEQKEGVMKQRNKLQDVYSKQRDNNERGQNKSYPSSVFLMYEASSRITFLLKNCLYIYNLMIS